MNAPAGSFQTSQRQVQTAVSSDIEMSIRKIDWRRVYRRVRSVPRETALYETVENIAWGVGGSALLSLIPLYQATESTEPWVKPTFWLVAIAAGIVGVLSHHFRKERRNVIRSSCEEVLQDMREVYATFFKDGSLDDED